MAANRIDRDSDPIADVLRRLHRAGWSVGDVAFRDRAGGRAWLVSGSNGEVESKLDDLLERVKDDDTARQEFLDLLEVLGPDDPRTAHYRKALTAKLY